MGIGDGEIYWQKIEPYLEEISIYDGPDIFLCQFNAAPKEVGHLFAAHWCVSEVSNGGFIQLFMNSTGVLVPEAVCGLTEIGLKDIAMVVKEAMKYFLEPYPRNREQRNFLLFGEVTDECASIFDEAMKLMQESSPEEKEKGQAMMRLYWKKQCTSKPAYRAFDDLNKKFFQLLRQTENRFHKAADEYAIRF